MKTNWSEVVHEVTGRRHAKTISEKQKEVSRLINIIDEQQKQLEVALALSDAKAHPSKIAKVKSGPSGSAVAFAIASDWHVEETVDPNTVNGLNAYNLTIAQQRVRSFFQKVVRLTEIQRHGTKIDTLVLALLGDLMTGYIHEELRETNGLSPTETILWLQDELASGLLLLEKNFGRIIIPCSWGNHGRTTIKPRHATGAKNSYEWMLYHIMRKQFPQFEWQISEGYHNYLDVDGRIVRMHHGDDLKYQGGVGGLTIPVEKAIAQWNRAIKADLDIFGHWHQSQQNPKWISNACFTGETKVMTPNGVVEIRNIRVGDEVFAHDGTLQVVENTLQKESDEGLIELRAKGLPDFVRCTPNHEFYAIKGESPLRQRLTPLKPRPINEKPQWIRAENLSEGDWVCTPELQGEDDFDNDLLWVYGLFTAEGHTIVEGGARGYVNRVEFTMHIKEESILQRAKTILDAHFSKHGRVWTAPEKNTSYLQYNGKEIAAEWRNLFGHTCYEKKVPPFVFSLTAECRESFVQGWFDGDGHRTHQKGGTTASRQLAWAIQWLSIGTSFDPMLYLRCKRPKGSAKGFCESYHIGFVGGQDVAYVEGKRFVRVDYRGRLADVVPVFDLQVSGPHTYNAGGMGVHNSLIGHNPYAIAIKAGFEPPSQTFFLMDSKRGRTVTCPIYLE